MKLDESNNLYTKSFAFAVRIVKFCKWINATNREYVLSKQLLKSGTSIGANVAEANGAISKADFSSKISIAYKESLETKYWLRLIKATPRIEEKMFDSVLADVEELSRILFSILKTTRIRAN